MASKNGMNMSSAKSAPYKVVKGSPGMTKPGGSKRSPPKGGIGGDDRVVVTVALKGDGDIVWVDYEDGEYITEPQVHFDKGEKIVFDGSLALVGITTYALLQLEKDGVPYFCYVKTPKWW